MTPREIFTAIQETKGYYPTLGEPTAEGRALLALRDLLISFLDATDKGESASMKAMSIDQIRLLNQLHLAIGL